MRKLLIILLFTTSAFGQFFAPHQKPNLGLQVNWGNPLSQGLVGHWLFNEDSGGQVFDLSGNKLTGTFSGDVTWATGAFGPVVDFAGITDYISAPLPYDEPDWTAITYIVRMQMDTTGIDQAFLRVKDSLIRYDKSGASLQFEWFPDVDQAAIAYNSNFVVDTWYHLAVTQDSSNNYAMYQDAQLVASGATFPLDMIRAGIGVLIGAYNTTGTWDLDGRIDYVMIYNRVLTASEINRLYRSPFCYMEPNWNVNFYVPFLAAPAVGAPQVIFIN